MPTPAPARRPLRRRVLVASTAITCLSFLGAFAYGAHRDHESGRLVDEAQARLTAPLAVAPGIDRVSASTAVSMLRRAQELGADSAEVEGWLALASGIEDLQRGDLVLAEGEVVSARHRLGDLPLLDVLAAAVARERRRPDEAAELLERALEAAPDDAQAGLLAADLALDHEDGATALRHLDALTAREPEVSALQNRRGVALEVLGDVAAATVAYEAAVQLDARATDAWINLGRARRRAGEHRAALEAFERAVVTARGNADAHLGRGLARAATGAVANAAADFRRAAELAPNDAEPLLALGDLQRDLGDVEDAVATYRRALAREDADGAAWLKLGNALALLEEYEQSARAFREALTRSPELAAAFNGLGASLMHTGDATGARIALARAAELDETDPNPLMNLALLHERAGDNGAARLAWTEALERDPASGVAQRRLARL